MAAKTPPTLLTLPREIRDQIWDYCLVSPTHRVLPVHYATIPGSFPSLPIIWTATRPTPHSVRYRRCPNAPIPHSSFDKTLHLVPCASTTATPLSSSLRPLAHQLHLVSRQLYAETCTRLWSANTLVLPEYVAAKEVLACLGQTSLRLQRVELVIGNRWDVHDWQILLMGETLEDLARLVQEGALRRLRLVYVDGGSRNRAEYQMWGTVLLTNDREIDWGKCERDLVWGGDKMRTDRLREGLARRWGLEGGTERRDKAVRQEDWEPVKQLEESGE